MALVLSRKLGESVVTAGPCRVTVVEIRRGKVRLAVEADRSVRVDRQEVAEKRAAGEGKDAA